MNDETAQKIGDILNDVATYMGVIKNAFEDVSNKVDCIGIDMSEFIKNTNEAINIILKRLDDLIAKGVK